MTSSTSPAELPPPRPLRGTARRCRVRLVAAALLVVVVGGLGALGVHEVADARWAEMQSWAASATQQWQQRDYRRTALWGETTAGSAFACYQRARDVAEPLCRADKLLKELWLDPEQVAPAEAAALRSRWAPAIAAMREGAHRADARPAVAFEKGFSMPAHNLLAGRWITNMAVIEARELRAAGRGREAVELLLDAATMGADLVRSPMLIDQMIGAALVVIATSEAWPAFESAHLDREALDLLAQGLARLDGLLPASLAYDGELLLKAHTFLNADPQAWPENQGASTSLAPGWRHGFSWRWMMADAFGELVAAAAELRAATDESWPLREQRLERIGARCQAAANPLLRQMWPNVASVEHTLRQMLTMVRLLRLAVDAHRGLPPAALNDPLGKGPIAVAETDAGVRFTSAGIRHHQHLERRIERR